MPELKKNTILIVDDDENLRKTLVFDFMSRGFNTLEAANGTTAFEIAKTHKVDLVLSDVRMPGGGGIELLNRLKSVDPNFPVVILVTGFADIDPEEAYDKGADAVFAKPFERKKLVEAVHNALLARRKPSGSRAHERVDVDLDVNVEFPELNLSMVGKVRNLGHGGLFVTLTDQFPQIKTRASFSIPLQGGVKKPIESGGQVRWIRMQNTTEFPSGCGIEFDPLSGPAQDNITALIAAYSPKT